MIVLPTARAVSARFLKAKESNSLLEPHITIGELFTRLIDMGGRRMAQPNERVVLMQRASDFTGFEKLQIERNFFTFIKNSEYIFRFFEELSGEERTIEHLFEADTYAEYDEHLTILEQLRQNYLQECNRYNLTDRMFLSEHYNLNEEYVKSLDYVEITLEGYLTRFELRILKELASQKRVIIRFFARENNKKMQDVFETLGMNLKNDHDYLLNLSENKIESTTKREKKANISLYKFSERIAQVGFVKKKIYDFVQNGIEPQNIVVIVPDENFAELLGDYDSAKNLNLAMGYSLNNSEYIRMLEAIRLFLSEQNLANSSRVQIYNAQLERLRPIWNRSVSIEEFVEICKELMEFESKKSVQEILLQSLHNFQKLDSVIEQSLFKELLQMWLKELSMSSLDDVGGGQITVMGVLESRSVAFEGVIVVDFNDSYVPKRSTKEMFLNSSVRRFSGLPDQSDRNELQKYYFGRLFEESKEVAISYVSDEQSSISKFTYEMQINNVVHVNQEDYLNLIFKPHERAQKKEHDIIQSFDFKIHALSATSLKSYLTCKRKFYYRYIEKIRPHQIEKALPDESEVGIWLHEALKNLYQKKELFTSLQELKSEFSKELNTLIGPTQMHTYLKDTWLQRLNPFFELEMQRFSNNSKVIEYELSLKKRIHGIELNGIIDRIDQTDNGYEVLDYKSGNFTLHTPRTIENATDFQLQFYKLLASQKYEITNVGYYSLKDGTITPEAMMDEKLAMLDSILKELSQEQEINFEKSESVVPCRFCDYIYLCGRG